MSWNHRIIKAYHMGEPYYYISEVFYGSREDPEDMSATGVADLISFGENNPESLRKYLEMCQEAFNKPRLTWQGNKLVEDKLTPKERIRARIDSRRAAMRRRARRNPRNLWVKLFGRFLDL